jgi:hypothetical protein
LGQSKEHSTSLTKSTTKQTHSDPSDHSDQTIHSYSTKELLGAFRKKFIQFKDCKIKVNEVRAHAKVSSDEKPKTRLRSYIIFIVNILQVTIKFFKNNLFYV